MDARDSSVVYRCPRGTNSSVATSEAQVSWRSAPVVRDQTARVTWQGYAALSSDFDNEPEFSTASQKMSFPHC